MLKSSIRISSGLVGLFIFISLALAIGCGGGSGGGGDDDSNTNTSTYYRDADNDSYGDPNNTLEADSQPNGYVLNNLDCDDTDENINPDATDIPNDGIDQNCDGQDTVVLGSIISSYPADGAINVGPMEDITITFEEEIDPSTITMDNVVLYAEYLFGIIVPSYSLSYDNPSRTITVRRLHDINSDKKTYGIYTQVNIPAHFNFTLTVDNLKTQSGNPIDSDYLSFSSPRYSRVVEYDQNQNIERYFQNIYNVNGFLERAIVYLNAGNDGTWFTSDDGIRHYFQNEQGTNGYCTREVIYDDAGPDTVWFTGDDEINYYNEYHYNGNGQIEYGYYSVSDGQDNIYFTPDDILSSFQRIFTWNDNRLTRSVITSIGQDNIWFTPDDGVSMYNEYTYDIAKCLEETTIYNGSGTDLVWFTFDDRIDNIDYYTRDLTGGLTYSYTAASEGTDGIWRTFDDRIFQYTHYIYDANGLLSREEDYSDTGIDGIWFTPDDVFDNIYFAYTYSATGILKQRTAYTNAGSDTIWFTQDDLYTGYSLYEVE